LSTVSDDTTGGRTAFSSRVPYWPGDDHLWGEAQKLRVVWAVQALTDACNTADPDYPSTLEKYRETHPHAEEEDLDEGQREWCLKEANRTPDQLQIIQTYDESFHITGLAVREDHGLDVAVAYPNPTAAYDENPLWQLSWGLGHSFIAGQDCENDATIVNDPDPDVCHNDGVRDLTVYEQDTAGHRIGNSTILERFGTSDPAWTGSPALWKMPRRCGWRTGATRRTTWRKWRWRDARDPGAVPRRQRQLAVRPEALPQRGWRRGRRWACWS
jgi:hypothetical protein